MRTVYLHLETSLDQEAARRCGYCAAPGVPPLHLLQIDAAATLLVEYHREQVAPEQLDLSFNFSSWAVTPPDVPGEWIDEAELLEGLRSQCAAAHRIVTFGGDAFERPLLHQRALVHGTKSETFMRRPSPHAVWSFRAGASDPRAIASQLQRLDSDPAYSLASYCAALGIPTTPTHLGHPDRDAQTAPAGPGTRALRAEVNVAALWLLDEFWRSGDDPGQAVRRWAMLRGEIETNPDLAHLRRVAAACPLGETAQTRPGPLEPIGNQDGNANNVVPFGRPPSS